MASLNLRGSVRTYHTAGHLPQLTDANGNITTWQYDLAGRQTQKRYADNTGDNFTYDAVGNLLTQQNAAGKGSVLEFVISRLVKRALGREDVPVKLAAPPSTTPTTPPASASAPPVPEPTPWNTPTTTPVA